MPDWECATAFMPKTIHYAKLKQDIEGWPDTWKGSPDDIVVGTTIVQAMLPFVQVMVKKHLAPTTIHRHMGNLWLLGGEVISRLHHDSESKGLSGHELLLRFVEEDGGPISRHNATEGEQKTFDGTCRKLHRFLEEQMQYCSRDNGKY